MASGGPSAIFSPALSTMIRRDRSINAHTMCSTMSSVTPSPWSRHQRHGALGLRRVEPGHELVEQEEPRGGGERARELQALLVDQRELRRETVRLALEADEREQTLGLRRGRARLAAGAPVETPDAHVVEGREPGERPHELE